MKWNRSLGISLAVLLLVIVSIMLWLWQDKGIRLHDLNKHLDVDQIKLGMSESEVIHRWGEGEYRYGFGGHGRAYKEKSVRVVFPDDSDHDLYQMVSELEMSSSNHSLYAIKVGDAREVGIDIIVSEGFKPVRYSQDIYQNGEFFIMINGEQTIESIRVWFEDKDLKDRYY